MNMADSEPIQIVRITPELWETYRDIRLRGLREDPQAFARTYAEEAAFPPEKWLERASSPYGFLAVANGVPLGIMGTYIPDESGERVAYIVGVFVAREARGKGTGSKLLAAVLEELKKDPTIRSVKLTVNRGQTPAVRLYEKFGFRVVGEETRFMGDGKEHTEYHMELR